MKPNFFIKLSAIAVAVIVSTSLVTGQTTVDPTLANTTTPHAVSVTSTHTYEVGYTTREAGAVPNIYTWEVRLSNAGGTDLGAAPGTDYTITAGADAAEQRIEWLTAGYYLVRMSESNPVAYGDCDGTAQVMLVHVVAPGTIQFAAPLTVNSCHTTGAISINLTLGGAVIDYPLTVTVQVQGEGTTRNITVADPGAGIPVLTIPAGAAYAENTSPSDLTRTVQIISALDEHSGSITVTTTGGVDTHTRTVYATPQLNPIHHD